MSCHSGEDPPVLFPSPGRADYSSRLFVTPFHSRILLLKGPTIRGGVIKPRLHTRSRVHAFPPLSFFPGAGISRFSVSLRAPRNNRIVLRGPINPTFNEFPGYFNSSNRARSAVSCAPDVIARLSRRNCIYNTASDCSPSFIIPRRSFPSGPLEFPSNLASF